MKKLVALLLALVLCVGMFACSNSETVATSPAAPADKAEDMAETVAPAAPADVDSEDDEEDTAEVKTINFEMFATSSYPTDAQKAIEDCINAITETEIGVHVNLHINAPGEIGNVVSVGIPAGDQVDLFQFCPVPSCALAVLVAQNEVIDMTAYLQEYAPKTLEKIANYLPSTTVDGKIYGVTNLRPLDEGFWLTMNKDILDEVGMTEKAESCDNWTTFEEIMTAVVSNTSVAGIGPNDANGSIVENYAFFVGAENWSDSFAFDNLGDQNSFIYTDPTTDTVSNYYETEYYKNAVTMAHDWYQKGLVYKDAAITDQTRDAQISGGLSMSISGQGGPATPITKQSSTKHNVVCKQVASPVLSNSNLVKFGYCMPATCKEPEAAAKFIEMMYNDERIATLLLWGEEGVDYVLNENGEACYPAGVDATSVRYHGNEDTAPNIYITPAWDGMGADWRETCWTRLQSTPVSKYAGFSCDTSSIANEITACFNVSKQYRAAMNCGLMDPEVELPKFIAELKDAGIDKIIACYQEQLTAWLANK